MKVVVLWIERGLKMVADVFSFRRRQKFQIVYSATSLDSWFQKSCRNDSLSHWVHRRLSAKCSKSFFLRTFVVQVWQRGGFTDSAGPIPRPPNYWVTSNKTREKPKCSRGRWMFTMSLTPSSGGLRVCRDPCSQNSCTMTGWELPVSSFHAVSCRRFAVIEVWKLCCIA